MVDCIKGAGIPDTRYLASPDFIALTLHCVTFIEIPILSYGSYCILFKTPTRMKSVKWLMLNLHVWSCLSDLVINVMGVPYILLPAPVGYGLGLIDAPSFMIYFMVTLIGALTASVLAIYENRFYMLFAKHSWWSKARKPFLFCIFVHVPLTFLPPFFDIPEQGSARQFFFSQIPCQPQFTFKDRQILVIALDYKVPLYSIGFGTTVLAVSITSFAILIFWKLAVWKFGINTLFSTRTREAQKSFAIALTIQSAFMLSFVLAPVVTILWVLIKWYHNQVLNNFVFITLSLHGVGSTIMMIFVHKPYRDFTLSKICCFSEKWKKEARRRSFHVSAII